MANRCFHQYGRSLNANHHQRGNAVGEESNPLAVPEARNGRKMTLVELADSLSQLRVPHEWDGEEIVLRFPPFQGALRARQESESLLLNVVYEQYPESIAGAALKTGDPNAILAFIAAQTGFEFSDPPHSL